MDPAMPINFLQLVGAERGKYHVMIFLSKNMYLDTPPEKYELPDFSDIPFIDEDPYEVPIIFRPLAPIEEEESMDHSRQVNSGAAATEETNISSEQFQPSTPHTPIRDRRQTFERSPISPKYSPVQPPPQVPQVPQLPWSPDRQLVRQETSSMSPESSSENVGKPLIDETHDNLKR
eukprot:8575060-Pyramimonas_sp.AAC.1